MTVSAITHRRGKTQGIGQIAAHFTQSQQTRRNDTE